MKGVMTEIMGIEGARAAAKNHLWMGFSGLVEPSRSSMPMVVRGEGVYIYDDTGRKYLDGLAGLFVVQAGHGREELASAAAEQAAKLAYFPAWGSASPPAAELAERLAYEAPGDINRVFFTTGGGDAVESAWKLAKHYFKLTGRGSKYKVISREAAYHGVQHGALAITALPGMKEPFEPLPPGAHHVANTNAYRHPEFDGDSEGFGRWAANQIDEAIVREGPETVAAVFLEPVQNSGGCFAPPPGYFARVREICNRYEVLLVSDEVICAFGRHGSTFAGTKFAYVPDIITCAKGMTSGYSPLGAMLVSEAIAEPFKAPGVAFRHGYTFGGHPVSAAVALANLRLMEAENLNGRVLQFAPDFERCLRQLLDIDIVGDVRGDGYFWAIELVSDKGTRQGFETEQRSHLINDLLPQHMLQNGLYCRAADRGGDIVIQLAPPLISGPDEFVLIEQMLRATLERVQTLI